MALKTVVVTGGNRGLGAGLAKYFSKIKGCNVGICSTKSIEIMDSSILHVKADVSNQNDVADFSAEVEKKFGVIDLWINNAGVLRPVKPISDLSSDDLHEHLNINLFGVLYGTQEFLKHLERNQRKRGCLVNISSGAARFGVPHWGAYCMSKAGVDRLTDCLKEEVPWLNCHSLAPGIINTDMQKYIRSLDETEFPRVKEFRSFSPSEFNSPEKVALSIWNLATATSQSAPVCLDIR